jgi:hypothetical protein
VKLIAPWHRVFCPFCFTPFHLADAARRETSTSAVRERDDLLGNFLAMPPPEMPRVEPPSSAPLLKRLGRRFVIHNEGSSDWKKVCPACHMHLPHKTASGELDSEVIAIIGTRNSGKSNFFGVLLNALERRYASEVGFRIFDQETFSTREMKPVSSKKLYRERYGKSLFEGDERRAIDQTFSAATNKETRIPLIYRLEFPRAPADRILHPLSSVKALDLVIFDAAGEDMGDPTMLQQFYRYILRAAGIIFVIDPFQYPGIRSQLPADVRARLPMVENDPAEIVARVINLFEQRAGLRAGQKIGVPVAFALAKSDLLRGIVHPSALLLREGRHDGGFNLPECQRLSAEVMECVREWDSPQLVDLAEKSFRSFSFFAFSALGELPDQDLRIQSVSPLRVADPLLWLLWRRGYIRALPERGTGGR